MKTKIILEMCANHNGNINIAKSMIDEAARLKVYGVKFQKRDIDSIQENFVNPFLHRSDMFGNSWKEHCRALEFDISEMAELKEHAENQELNFSCTAFDVKSIQELLGIGINDIKLPSQLYLDKKCYLELSSSDNIFVSVSTGMHTFSQIINCAWFYDADILYYCISKYPAKIKDLNFNTLKTILMLRKNVGYSSHEIEGCGIPYSVLLGVKRIERHYTLNKNSKGADHKISSDYSEMLILIETIKIIEDILGDNEREIDEEEKKIAEVFKCLNLD